MISSERKGESKVILLLPKNKTLLLQQVINIYLKINFTIEKENECHNVNFDKLKIMCCNCNEKGHYARECQANPRGKFKGRLHDSISIKDEPPTNNSLND